MYVNDLFRRNGFLKAREESSARKTKRFILWLIFIIFVVIWIVKHQKYDKVFAIKIIKHDRYISWVWVISINKDKSRRSSGVFKNRKLFLESTDEHESDVLIRWSSQEAHTRIKSIAINKLDFRLSSVMS